MNQEELLKDNQLPRKLAGAGGGLRWGIIGCGDVTEVKSGPAFNRVEGSELIAVMRRDADKAADYAKRHGVPKWYSDADDLMNDPNINAVYIATPPVYHKQYALDALKRGLYVYVEKPVTINKQEAEDIAVALKQANTKLVVAHYRRALPMFLFVKDLLGKNTIGDVRTVQIKMWQSRKPKLIANSEQNWRVNPELSGGGYFHDLAPHQLDLMLYFFGAPLKLDGLSLNQANVTVADDHVAGLALFPNNVVLNGSWSFNVDEQEQIDECKIIGSAGSITFPFFGKKVVWQNEQSNGIQQVDFEHPKHIEEPFIQHMVSYFKGNADNLCSIDEAIIVMKMMDAFTVKV